MTQKPTDTFAEMANTHGINYAKGEMPIFEQGQKEIEATKPIAEQKKHQLSPASIAEEIKNRYGPNK
ncbi:MAG: hypothetical protein FWC83_00255 [Alphaproteobacteria bacterium]|nr:hypothetical protein [Alphaproteobacteria bacterium]